MTNRELVREILEKYIGHHCYEVPAECTCDKQEAINVILQELSKVPKEEKDIVYLGKGKFECRHVKEDTIVEDCAVCTLHWCEARIKHLDKEIARLRGALKKIVSMKRYTFAECSDAEFIMDTAKNALKGEPNGF